MSKIKAKNSSKKPQFLRNLIFFWKYNNLFIATEKEKLLIFLQETLHFFQKAAHFSIPFYCTLTICQHDVNICPTKFITFCRRYSTVFFQYFFLSPCQQMNLVTAGFIAFISALSQGGQCFITAVGDLYSCSISRYCFPLHKGTGRLLVP
jgi:hypothetical protein